MNMDTEVLFPARLIPHLRELRGKPWQELIDRVEGAPALADEKLAFVLMMVRLGNCTACHSDTFWAMRGCSQCAKNTISRYRGSDTELLELYTQAVQELPTLVQKKDNEKKKGEHK